jgi:mRNA degradation ribonuclease J1/J2
MQFHQIHASGHMSKDQLIEMVKTIDPEKAVPVHAENQQLFKNYCNCIQFIEKE